MALYRHDGDTKVCPISYSKSAWFTKPAQRIWCLGRCHCAHRGTPIGLRPGSESNASLIPQPNTYLLTDMSLRQHAVSLVKSMIGIVNKTWHYRLYLPSCASHAIRTSFGNASRPDNYWVLSGISMSSNTSQAQRAHARHCSHARSITKNERLCLSTE